MTILDAPPTIERFDDGAIEAHSFDTPTMYCRVERCIGEPHWSLNIDSSVTNMSRAQQMENARAVIDAGRALLTLNRRKRSTRSDDALSVEVRALIADRGWTQQQAADEFGMAPATLSALLNGHSRWTLEAACAVAQSIADGDALLRLINIYKTEAGR